MTLGRQAFKEGSWLALFKLISQMFSWAITIIVARLLVPEDYGLMAMSTIITGYAEMFSELGLGAAIIQRKDIEEKELSSIFWFAVLVSSFFAFFSFLVAAPTALIFNEPRVIPLTQTVSVLFILSGLRIVPMNLLKKELAFKKVGFIEMVATITSCFGMLLIAYWGGGVWTLIGGRIIRGCIHLVLTFKAVEWRPKFHFNTVEVQQFVKFGILVALSQSCFYLFQKSDRFFAGREWDAMTLGYYAFAMQLAQIPTEKIVVLINQISFPVFSKCQHEPKRFNEYYLEIVKLTSTIVFPIFAGGFLLGDELIKMFLDEKWYPIIFIFKWLCLSQIITSINAINDFVQISKGRPSYSLYYNVLLALGMTISFAFIVDYGLNAIIVPWLTTYLLICASWIAFTLKINQIMISDYCKAIKNSVHGTLIMTATVISSRLLLGEFKNIENNIKLLILITVASVSYIFTISIIDRHLLNRLKSLKQKN